MLGPLGRAGFGQVQSETPANRADNDIITAVKGLELWTLRVRASREDGESALSAHLGKQAL